MGDIVRRGTKDRPRFYIRYVDVDGRRKQRAVKGAKTKGEAQVVLNAAELRVSQGKVGIEEPTPQMIARSTITVRQLGDRFVEEYKSPKLKDPKRYQNEARNILAHRVYPELGNKPAAAVTLLDVERMRDRLTAEGYTAPSVVLALAALSKVYNWGGKVGAVDCANPVKGCERPRSHASIDYLSRDEVTKALEWSEARAPYVHPMIATAIYTGMRKGELFGLRWPDVHLDMARIDVMRSYRLLPKSGKARHVPMHPELLRILRAWKERCPKTGEGLVFPVDGRMGDRFESCGLGEILDAAHCHVPDKPWHALRHTFASHFMMSGGNILTLQKLLGHSSVSVTMIYAHLAPDFMASEVARMSFTSAAAADVTDLGEVRRARAAAENGQHLDTTSNRDEKGAELAPETSMIKVVSPEGVEPSTNGLRVRCSAS